MANAARGVAASTVKAIGAVRSPADLRLVAKALVDHRSARHQADYDLNETFSKSDSTNYLDQAREAFEAWERVRRDPVSMLFLHLLPNYDDMRS